MRRAITMLMLPVAVLAMCAWAPGQVLLDDLFTPAPVTALAKFGARAIPSVRTVRPGDSLYVAVEMTIAEKFWVYGPYAAGKIVPAQDMTIEPGKSRLKVGKVLFGPTHPHVTDFPDGTRDTHNVYEGRVYAYVPATVPSDLPAGKYELPLVIEGQVCDPNVCLQLSTTVTATVQVSDATTPNGEWTGPVSAALAAAKTAGQWREELAEQGEPIDFQVFGGSAWAQLGLAGGLALAFLAGMILNVMPCVLPVIPLRLLALLNQAEQSRRRFISLGIAFAGGIVLFFVAIAAVGAAAKLATGYTLTLNDLFRHQPVVIALVLVLVALAANMFDVFTLTVPGKVAQAEPGQGHLGAVGMGFLMAVLSTPCSGAVLAFAFAWAQLQSPLIGALSLVVMGLGMAAPHAVLAFFPGVVSRIPRAGRWTALLKESVGFVLLLIAVWMLGTQLADRYLAWVMAYAVVLATCLWIWGKWVSLATPPARKWAIRLGAAGLAVACGVWMLTPPGAPLLKMQPFDAGEVAAARKERTVLVKFTAAWCVECLVVEKKIYEDPDVAARLLAEGVLAVKGDVTRSDMPATRMLYDQLRQAGPPLTAVFPRGGAPPILLRGSFSREDLFKALDMAAGRR